MDHDGPALETLTRRLAETPPDFLAEPRIGAQGSIHVAAVVSDLLVSLGGQALTNQSAAPFIAKDAKKHRNRLSLVLIACWLYQDDWFSQKSVQSSNLAPQTYEFLANQLTSLADIIPAPDFVTDPDHREELARLALSALQMRPAGESRAQAQDRLSTLDSVERQRVLAASRKAEERARAVLEAMASKAAQDASDKWSRE